LALEPLDDVHASQILAGIRGRLAGHKFEESLTAQVNELGRHPFAPSPPSSHHASGSPAKSLLNFLAYQLNLQEVREARAAWLGGLATGGGGSSDVDFLPERVKRSKSDVVVSITTDAGTEVIGVSVKTCQKKTPTNAQVFFTTAEAFCDRLSVAGLDISDVARRSIRMFCGDEGFKPGDLGISTSSRDRFYWEELPEQGRKDWEELFDTNQDQITDLLVRSAYPDDPIPPSTILHQRSKAESPTDVPVALYSVEEFLAKSRAYSLFTTRKYRVLKGSSRDPNTWHEAPRFGVVQFQRGGQKQHPTQLQFNLKAGYFNEELFVEL